MKTLSDLLEENSTLCFDPFPLRVKVYPWNSSSKFQARIDELEGERVKVVRGPFTGEWDQVMLWLEKVLVGDYPYVWGILHPSPSALERVSGEDVC
jgi:hypothetical protein